MSPVPHTPSATDSEAPLACTVDPGHVSPEALGMLCGDRWASGRSEEEFLRVCGQNSGVIAPAFRVEKVPTLAAVAAADGAKDVATFWAALWHGSEFSALEQDDEARKWFLCYFYVAAQDRWEIDREQRRKSIDLARERREQSRRRFSKYGATE
jgi:hypothetical protein